MWRARGKYFSINIRLSPKTPAASPFGPAGGAGPRQVFFDQHTIVAESAGSLALGPGECGGKLGGTGNPPHAAAAAAANGLDQYRKADPLGLVQQTREILVFAVIARHQRHARS